MEGNIAYEEARLRILNELNQSLSLVSGKQVEQLIDEVLAANQVFFVGVGRVLLSLKAIAKRWAHLGITVHIVGDINEPAITSEDLLIVGSGSGSTLFPLGIAKKAKQYGAKVVHVGSNPASEMKDIADYMVRIPVHTKANLRDEIPTRQPMTSLFEQSLLILGDIITIMIIEKKGLDINSLWIFHANLE